MPFPWLAMALGTLAGGAKHAVDVKNRNKRVRGEGDRARWSPWTGYKAQVPDEPNPLGALLGGGLAGAQFGMQFMDTPVDGSYHYDPNAFSDDYYVGKLGVDTNLPGTSGSLYRGLAGK